MGLCLYDVFLRVCKNEDGEGYSYYRRGRKQRLIYPDIVHIVELHPVDEQRDERRENGGRERINDRFYGSDVGALLRVGRHDENKVFVGFIHEIVEELKRKIQGKRDYPAYRQRLEFRVRHPHHCAGNNSGRYTHGEDIRTIFSLCASGAVYNFGSDSGKENVYEKGGVLHYQQLFRTYTGGI